MTTTTYDSIYDLPKDVAELAAKGWLVVAKQQDVLGIFPTKSAAEAFCDADNGCWFPRYIVGNSHD